MIHPTRFQDDRLPTSAERGPVRRFGVRRANLDQGEWRGHVVHRACARAHRDTRDP